MLKELRNINPFGKKIIDNLKKKTKKKHAQLKVFQKLIEL